MADNDFSRYGLWSVRGALVLAISLVCAFLTAAQAQIRTDGTLGRPAVGLTGPSFLITETLGRLAGSNLFYSFQVFNVGNTESATFTTTTAGLTNLISRVTGGSPSQINGLVSVQSTNAAPNFFFINPAGVVFGKGAQIDVPAGFNVSTANYLKFPDGNFYADPKAVSTLSSAAPEAFGFLGTTRGTVAVKDGATLSTNLLQPSSMIAGDIEIDGGNVTTSGADIRIVALGQRTDEISLTGPLPAAYGNLNILHGGKISSPSIGTLDAGNISVSAGSITIDRQGSTNTTGILSQANSGSTGNAGTVEVTAAGSLSVVNGGVVSSGTFSRGNAGSVKVSGGAITIDGQGSTNATGIASQANSGSGGNAGSVAVTATGNLSVLNGGSISSSTFASGNAGTVTVGAGSITIDRGGGTITTGIFSQANPGSTGHAGPVTVTAMGNLWVLNGGEIASSTFSSGDAGSVMVSAGAIAIDAQGFDKFGTGIFSVAELGSSGHAGTVEVNAAGTLTILNGGEIASSTFSSGDAGSVKVSAGNITIDSQGFTRGGTGIFSLANLGSIGSAGEVNVTAAGNLSVLNGGVIASSTYSSGDAGTVTVNAGNITIDSGDNTRGIGGIASQAISGSGNAGPVNVTAAGNLSVLNGSVVSSSTFTKGNAGLVNVTVAGNLSVLNGGVITSSTYSSGDAGTVMVHAAGALSILNGGEIASSTFSSGDAGSVKVSAGIITIDNQGYAAGGTGIFSQANPGSTGSAGDVNVTAAANLSVLHGGSISSTTFSSGDAGSVTVSAGSSTIDSQGYTEGATGILSQADVGSSGHAGTVEVNAAGRLTILNGGEITSSTFSTGDAGSVMVSAGSITVDRSGSTINTGILSQANPGSTGHAGPVTVTATGNLWVLNGGEIASSTFSSGDAGSVKVSAGDITIDAQGFDKFATGIFSVTDVGGTGHAGTVQVNAAGTLTILNGGEIASSTFSSGDAGSVKVSARNIAIDGQGFDKFATGILSQAEVGSSGHAGTVEVTAVDHLSVVNGGSISSTTFAFGDAGTVKVVADSITIDAQGFSRLFTGIFSQANFNSYGGNAGSVEVTTKGSLSVLNGGLIGSDTFSYGNAGSVKVSAQNITIDGQGNSDITGIVSRAGNFSFGNAGSVDVTASENLRVVNGGTISSSTNSYGNAGAVKVAAGSLLVDGSAGADHPSSINARAGASSFGQTGSVSVTGSDSITLSNGGELSITNLGYSFDPASISPTLLSVSAPNISLSNGGQITAASSRNIAASNIQVDFGSRLSLADSAITTSAQDGNGGAIQITGRGVLSLHNAQITTSVAGLSGNGGDINVRAHALAMDTGFIQANTAAANASGGKVNINVDALVPSGNTLFVGGSTPFTFAPGVFGFNVIQAAAPTGVSGTIQISTPVLDISGSISALTAKFLDSGGLGRSPCAIAGGSSLSQVGRGGLPLRAGDLLWIDPVIEVPPMGSPRSGTVVLPYRTAGSNVSLKPNPCWS